MNDTISVGGPSLVALLHRIRLPPGTRDRLIAIDQDLTRKLTSDDLDADCCASLIIEAADLIADREPAAFDWFGWDDAGFVGSDGWEADFAERMLNLAARTN
ncbi:hypothetical protein F9K79_05755 [Ochrobactrum sp. Kaboul]|nr:hypothetical protein F9K79_05755 [Ochrobactrum sp. Kaboul]